MAGIVAPPSYRFGRLTWNWDFGVDGALALEPQRLPLQEEATFVTVPRMPRASAHARRRRAETAAARRKRRLAGLILLASVALITLLLTAFGSGGRTRGPDRGARTVRRGCCPPARRGRRWSRCWDRSGCCSRSRRAA